MTDSVERLYEGVIRARQGDPTKSRTARLLRSGRAKMAKKLAEEAVEVVIDAMNGSREAVVKESADLIYNLVVLWVASGVQPQGGVEGDGPARAAVRYRREAHQGCDRRSAPQGRRARKPPARKRR